MIGAAAPDFSGIVGIDDKPHGLADFKDAKLVVLVFTCNHCPVAQAYEDRLVALQKDYRPKGVQVVAVNVNNMPADRLDEMKKRAKQMEFNFPYLYDSTQKIGHDYHATVTPHVFVLDQQRKIAYMGAVDDSQQAGQVKKHYLRDALDALLAGKKAAAGSDPAIRLRNPIRMTDQVLVPTLRVGTRFPTLRVDRESLWCVSRTVQWLLALAACLLLTGCPASPPSAAGPPLRTIDAPGLARLLDQHRGQVVLVDFWATWCGPCVKLFPHTVELERRFRDRGLAVITVSLDDPADGPAVRKFLDQNGATTENYLSSYGVGPEAMTAFGIADGALPHVRIYDAEGRLRKTFTSGGRMIDPKEIESAVEGVLKR